MDLPAVNTSLLVVPQEETNPIALILDESGPSADLVATCLKAGGFDALAAKTIQEARESILKRYDRIGVIVASTTLPGVAGAEMLAEVLDPLPLVPVILLGEQMPEIDGQPVGSRLVFARLERPVSAEAVAAAGQRAKECFTTFNEIVRRRLFLDQASYLEEPIARVLHDLNNQVTGLKGGMDLLGYAIEMVRDPETQAKFSRYMGQFIQPSLAQIETLIRNWRQMREHRLRRAVTTDLVDVARRAVALAANPLQQKRVTLSVGGKETSLERSAGPTSGLSATVYADQLAMGLAYVVQNAIESIEDRANGRVSIEMDTTEDNMCRIRILDNGPGIPAENRAQIWRSFFSTKERGRTGLGLSIAKQIVDKQQSQIECVDSHLGGAGIQVLIPLAEEGMKEEGRGLKGFGMNR